MAPEALSLEVEAEAEAAKKKAGKGKKGKPAAAVLSPEVFLSFSLHLEPHEREHNPDQHNPSRSQTPDLKTFCRL